MVDRGEEEDDTEDDTRIGKPDMEVSYSETDGRGMLDDVE